MTDSAVTIRQLRVDDIPLAMTLKDFAGWNQTERDWRGYLEFEPRGCFLAEVDARPVGTATSIGYGGRLGWIGMVLVHPEARRLGIGTRLLHQTIAYLRGEGVGCVKLDATPMGRHVYLPLGFVDEYAVSRYQATAPRDLPPPADDVIPLENPADLTELDAEAFGAARPDVPRSLGGRDPGLCFAHVNGGYLIAREGHYAVQIGPWTARDAASAEALLRAFLRQVPGKPVLVDVPHPNAAALALVERHGFSVQRGFIRMYLGENRFPGEPGLVYGTSGAEKG